MEIVDVPRARAAVVRAIVPLTDLPSAQRAARTKLDATFGGATLPRLTIWRMPANGVMDYAPGILLDESTEAPDDIEVVDLPTGRAAHSVLVGPFDGLGKAWGHLFEASAGRGLKTAGLNWEIYSPSGATNDRTELFALLA
jgi:effector-binding domain-containing protein